MTQSATGKINIGELLEESRIGPLQIRVFVLCMICLIMDGFDVQAMGYVAPAVIRDFGVGGPALGPVFAAANVGVLIGSRAGFWFADRATARWLKLLLASVLALVSVVYLSKIP